MRKFFLLFLFLTFFSFLGTKNTYACNENCYEDYSCLRNMGCADCLWCLSPTTIPDPVENTDRKVINPVLPNKLTTMPGTVFLKKVLVTSISFMLLAGSVIFFFVLLSGGIKWLSSSGDKNKMESAQKQISSGLVGLVILLSSFAVIKLIETVFGIDLLNITLPTL